MRKILFVSPGRPAFVAWRCGLHRVRGDSVRLGAAAHLTGRLLLQGQTATSGQGWCSSRYTHTEDKLDEDGKM